MSEEGKEGISIEIFEIPLLSPLLQGIPNKLPNWPINVYLSEEAILGSQK